MRLFKSLLASQDDQSDVEPATPSEARRAAAEEALDRIIAERAAAAAKAAPAAQAGKSSPAPGVRAPDAQQRRPTGFGRRPNRVD